MELLKVKNINTYYGQVHALKNISLHLRQGEIVTLIGANGAGKTTISTPSRPLPRPRAARSSLTAADPACSPERIVELGISQVPEGRQVFKPLTVEDNLELGAYLRFRRREARKAIRADLEEIYTLFPRLLERRKQLAGTLSGGEQQMLAIGRALMAKPTAAAPRRAVHGTGAAGGPGDLRGHRRPEPRQGDDRPAGRAECQGCPENGRPRLCPGNRQGDT